MCLRASVGGKSSICIQTCVCLAACFFMVASSSVMVNVFKAVCWQGGLSLNGGRRV